MKTNEQLTPIAEKFSIDGDILSIKPLGPGFINDTFIVNTSEGYPNYILQRKNKNVFKDVPSMMDNIIKVTDHIRKKIMEAGGDAKREVLTVVLTHDNKPFVIDDEGEYWTVCRFIEGSQTFEKADTEQLAYKGGEGVGRFQKLLVDFNEELSDTIKGFHNIRYRFEQWDKALKEDKGGRVAELAKEIEWIESRRPAMLEFWEKVETGEIPRRVTHNDTKLSNILFDLKGDVLCMIDLDTVMSSTSLNDYGDAIRSYANTGAEDDPDLDNVALDLKKFEAFTRGYLKERGESLTPAELENLAFSALYITYEQTLRFLMDYIDGDTYYKIAYPNHNLVRTHAQHKLLKSMEENYEKMEEIVKG